MSLNTTFVASTTAITAAHMNGIQAAWDTYSPTPTNFTVGNGTLAGRYLRLGKSLLVRINFTAGGTSSFTASQTTVSLPFAVHATGLQYLNGRGQLSTIGPSWVGASVAAGASTATLEVPTGVANVSLVGMSSASPNPGTTGSFMIEGVLELA